VALPTGLFAATRPSKTTTCKIDDALTLPGVVSSRQFGRELGAMSYIAFVLGRALTVAMVVGLSLLLLITIACCTAMFVLYS
jgi:hypothetical protein